MEAKKKKKIIIIVCVAILVVAVAIIGIVFGLRRNNNENPSQNASNVNTTTTTITNTYNEAIAKEEIPPNYNGFYKYSHVASIDFHFDDYPANEASHYIQTICDNKGVRDVNGLINLLNQEQLKETNNATDVLIFENGIYTKNKVSKDTYGNDKYFPIETGNFVGDDNLAVVRINGENSFFMSLNYLSSTNAIIVSRDDVINDNYTKLYIYETVVSKNDPTLELFTITYVYDMFIPDYSIPDQNLDF